MNGTYEHFDCVVVVGYSIRGVLMQWKFLITSTILFFKFMEKHFKINMLTPCTGKIAIAIVDQSDQSAIFDRLNHD